VPGQAPTPYIGQNSGPHKTLTGAHHRIHIQPPEFQRGTRRQYRQVGQQRLQLNEVRQVQALSAQGAQGIELGR
jgi:hypothetical protein